MGGSMYQCGQEALLNSNTNLQLYEYCLERNVILLSGIHSLSPGSCLRGLSVSWRI